MKRRELIKKLEQNGFVLTRHGGNHDVYVKGTVELIVPRHREINEITAKQILRKGEQA